MPVDYRPHLQYYDRTTGLPTTEHVADYVMLSNNGQNLYVQQGRIYFNGTDPVDPAEAPAWFWEAYERLTPAARRSVGMELPGDKVQSLDQLPAEFVEIFNELPEHLKAELLGKRAPRIDEKAPKISTESSDMGARLDALKNDSEAPRPKTWTCDECGAEEPTTRKGVHIARHRRAAKKGQ